MTVASRGVHAPYPRPSKVVLSRALSIRHCLPHKVDRLYTAPHTPMIPVPTLTLTLFPVLPNPNHITGLLDNQAHRHQRTLARLQLFRS